MGKVLSGKYEGGKVTQADGFMCLCVKINDQIIPLDSLRVDKCELKDATFNPFSTLERTYLIKWHDGSKSILGMEKAYGSMLITGCETAQISDEDIQKIRHNKWTAVAVGAITFLVLIGIFYLFCGN